MSGARQDRIVERVRRSRRTAEGEGGDCAHVLDEEKKVVVKRIARTVSGAEG